MAERGTPVTGCGHRRCARARCAALTLTGLAYLAFAILLIDPSLLAAAAAGVTIVCAAAAFGITCPGEGTR